MAKRPISTEPIAPPTACTPTTSSESSKPSRYLRLIAAAQTAPAIRPMAIAPSIETEPQAGVMATRPATAPEAAPSEVKAPCFSFS